MNSKLCQTAQNPLRQSQTAVLLRRSSLAALVLLAAGPAQAWDSCDNKRELTGALDLSTAEQLSIVVGAGDLSISGKSGLQEARIEATVCASRAEDAAETRLVLKDGKRAELTLDMPRMEGGWSSNRYLYTDLRIEVPEQLALAIRDTSGDVNIGGAGSIQIKDSSGDVRVRSSASVEIEDSSGDIGVRDIAGDVTVIKDSSGDIEGQTVGGSVLIGSDSSGDIEFVDITGDFLVERDSSGDIEARDVGGNFDVLRDGSGSISYRNIDGAVRIPEEKR